MTEATYHGTILRVFDNKTSKGKPYWSVVIDTDAKGEVKFNLWEHEYAGLPDKDGNPPVCDVHDLVDCRVIFGVKAGAIKDEATGERYPATIELLQLEEEGHMPSEPSIGLDPLQDALDLLEAAKARILSAMTK